MKAELTRRFFACCPATKKFRILGSFQIEQIRQLVDIERHLSAVDVDQVGHRLKAGCSGESAEDIRCDLVVKDNFAISKSVAPRLVMGEPIGTAETFAVRVA